MRRLQARMGRLRGGRGLDGAVDMGARGTAARDQAQRYVSEAQRQGAQVSQGADSEVPGKEGPQDATSGSEGARAGDLDPQSDGALGAWSLC